MRKCYCCHDFYILDIANLPKNHATCKMKMYVVGKIHKRVDKNGTKNIDFY